MKTSFFLAIVVLCFVMLGCQVGHSPEAQPITDTTIVNKTTLLKHKKETLDSLKKMIVRIEMELDTLEPKKYENQAIVTTMPIIKKRFEKYITVQAKVEPNKYVNASGEIGGRITQLLVKEGTMVRRNQVLAKLDLEQINKQTEELQITLNLAQEVYKRQSKLWSENIGSELQYLRVKTDKEKLEKNLQSLLVQKKKAFIYAPISGVVEKVLFKQGELVNIGMPIVQIMDVSKVKIIGEIPEIYLGVIKKGTPVSLNFPAINQTIKAKISQLGRVINPTNRTFNVEVKMNNHQGIFKPNLLANMQLNEFTADNVITIPLEIIQQEIDGKEYVFVSEINKQTTIAKKKYISTGAFYEGEIVVVEGLTEGDSLIIEGAQSLQNNQLIKIEQNRAYSALF